MVGRWDLRQNAVERGRNGRGGRRETGVNLEDEQPEGGFVLRIEGALEGAGELVGLARQRRQHR